MGRKLVAAKSSDIGSYFERQIASVNFQKRKMASPQNIVGPSIRALRREKGLTQAMLAARCGILGWDIGENTITKIETQIRCIVDAEILCLSKALETTPEKFFPSSEKAKAVVKGYFAERPSRLDS